MNYTVEWLNTMYNLSGCTSHKEFADLVGITECSLSRYLHGHRALSFKTFYKIADKLGYEVVIREKRESYG